MIAIIAIMLTTGVAAFGLNNADDGGFDLSDHGSHSKITHEKKSANSGNNKDSNGKSSEDITLDITMQQNVNNYLFNIPTAFILDVDEYNENTYTYNKIYLPDGDEYEWEVDLEILEFDLANGRNLTQEDVESYVNESFEETTINGIEGYYYQDEDGWEIFVFGSGNELITLQVYGISLEVVLNDFTQEPLAGDLEAEESLNEEEATDDSTYEDSSSDDSSYDDSGSDYSSYDESYYDDSSYDDSGSDYSSYDESYNDYAYEDY